MNGFLLPFSSFVLRTTDSSHRTRQEFFSISLLAWTKALSTFLMTQVDKDEETSTPAAIGDQLLLPLWRGKEEKAREREGSSHIIRSMVHLQSKNLEPISSITWVEGLPLCSGRMNLSFSSSSSSSFCAFCLFLFFFVFVVFFFFFSHALTFFTLLGEGLRRELGVKAGLLVSPPFFYSAQVKEKAHEIWCKQKQSAERTKERERERERETERATGQVKLKGLRGSNWIKKKSKSGLQHEKGYRDVRNGVRKEKRVNKWNICESLANWIGYIQEGPFKDIWLAIDRKISATYAYGSLEKGERERETDRQRQSEWAWVL